VTIDVGIGDLRVRATARGIGSLGAVFEEIFVLVDADVIPEGLGRVPVVNHRVEL
jgi:hypothetical protein